MILIAVKNKGQSKGKSKVLVHQQLECLETNNQLVAYHHCWSSKTHLKPIIGIYVFLWLHGCCTLSVGGPCGRRCPRRSTPGSEFELDGMPDGRWSEKCIYCPPHPMYTAYLCWWTRAPHNSCSLYQDPVCHSWPRGSFWPCRMSRTPGLRPLP